MRRQSSWVRYGLARLRPLGRPVFWAPSIALLLLVLFAWEFFSRPELMSYLGISDPDATLSPEEQAIGADIDSLPLLMNDIKISAKSDPNQTAIASPTQAAAQPNSTAPNRLFSAATDATETPKLAQPQSDPGVFGVFTNALTARLGLPTTQPIASDPNAPAPLPANRLQEALSKLATENRSIVSQTPIEGTIRLDHPLLKTSITAAPQPSNSFSVLIGGTKPIAERGVGIAPGIAPTISAPLPIEVNGATIAPPLNSPVASPQPAESSNFGVIQNAPIVNSQPFTVPRSIPGRAIGGGNINTFSNP